MQSKAEVQAAVWEYLRRKDMSAAELARRAGIPGATLNRMLRDDPTYQGRPDHWTQLARFEDLRLDEAEVLAAVGLGPRPNGDTEPDPWALFERALRRLPFTERHRQHLHFQAEVLLRDSQATPSVDQ